MSRITLIGGHGKVALLAAPLLVDDGHEVISVVRNPDHVADTEATGATALVLDVENSTTEQIAEALRGSDVVVWSAGAGGGSPERTYAVDRDAAIRSMAAAAEAGVERYVMVSYFGAGPDHGVSPDNGFYAYAEAKAAADEHLKGTDLAWTILRPSGLTLEDATGHIESGAGVAAGSVSRDNVAHVIRSVVGHPETTARRIIAFNDGLTPIEDVIHPRTD
ncbi:putative NADH-flavin reductase [Humibacillus xanthopallidus]|uniref:Putative NADH-flavin reductase n=1 Tax=Humibacillus xanthopallidus TaxID=412689 RepID=A0A543PKR8_9MICO|nr:NAD(P)-binding oxidoreductase [Humibacillus xanthopallidus]TQN44677.1 putative NADH-flavin reductase [Humibacillus xanthopallidus]